MSIRFLIIVLALMSSSLKAQVINWVNYAHQADVKVFFVEHKWQADVVVWYAPSGKARTYGYRPGVWIERPQYGKPEIHVWQARYKHQADVKVYVAQHRYEVRVNQKYLNLISNQI